AMYGLISAAPSAQFSPIVIGLACRTEFQNASTVWPDRIRPEASVTVPEIITGRRAFPFAPDSSKYWSIANRAALAFRVSKMVSTRNRSTPPSARARACSRYAATSSSKVTLRAPGSLTSGEIEAVFGVGPKAPATKRGDSGVEYFAQASLAIFAAARFISDASDSMW